jgi:acetyl-CoA C-acetyltransferase
VIFGSQAIQTGNAHIIVVGGMESMSQTPYYLPKYRTGVKMGHQQLIDGIIVDGLWDPYHQFLMGDAAELCAKNYGISREEQDEYAILSYKRAIEAAQSGVLGEYGVSINPKGAHGGVGQHTESSPSYFDENLQRFDESKLRKLKPVFKAIDGTVTAGNASGISDGACALVLVSGKKSSEFDLQPLAKIISFADAQQDSEKFTTSPSLAIRKALDLACLSTGEIDVFEINEAFAVVALANQKLLKLPSDKLNILGGSVALGHPLGW